MCPRPSAAAQDYLLKGRCDGEAIARAIRYAIDRKRIEEELRQARNELETRVQQRTEQLARSHADLLKAKEAAEAASRAKSAFLANMSHDMRTPLNAIIGMTELVLHDQVPPRQREYLSTVEGSAETLLALIENLLDLSSIDAGKVTLATATFDLWRNLGEAMAPLAQRAQRQGLQLDWRIAPACPASPAATGTACGRSSRTSWTMPSSSPNEAKWGWKSTSNHCRMWRWCCTASFATPASAFPKTSRPRSSEWSRRTVR